MIVFLPSFLPSVLQYTFCFESESIRESFGWHHGTPHTESFEVVFHYVNQNRSFETHRPTTKRALSEVDIFYSQLKQPDSEEVFQHLPRLHTTGKETRFRSNLNTG